MPDPSTRYFDLSLTEQAELLNGLAPELGRRAEILEKDIWLCQVLGVLFALPAHEIAIEVSENAEELWLYYPSAVENMDAYLRPNVLIEFGGRNATLPQNTMTISPDVAAIS